MKSINVTGLVWTQLVNLPFHNIGNMSGQPFVFLLNGYLSVLIVLDDYNGHYVSWVCFSVNDAGQVCTYKSASYIYGGNFWGIETNIQQSGNAIKVVSVAGLLIQFLLPNIFVAGGNFVVPTVINAPLLSPCGGASLTNSFYLDGQKLIAYEFVHSFGAASNIYATITSDNGDFLGGGYIGNYPDGVDGFNQFSLSLPTAAQEFFRNSFYVYCNFSAVGYQLAEFGFSQPLLNGDYTTLNCGSPTPSVNITNTKTFKCKLSDFNLPAPNGSDPSELASSLCDMQGYFCMSKFAPQQMLMFSKDYFILLNTPNILAAGAAALSKKNKLYVLNAYDNFATGLIIYQTNFDFSPIQPVPQVQKNNYNGLANYHRSVSPSGSFQA